MDNRIGNFSLLIGSTILFFIFFLLLSVSISFAFGFSLTAFVWCIAFSPAVFCAWQGVCLYFKERTISLLVVLLALVLFMFVFSVYVSGKFYDTSWDGQEYHQEAIIQLREGWNPFYHPQLPASIRASIWINPYAKAPWFYEAALYALTGHIEQAKAFNFLIMCASFFISFSALLSLGRIRPIIALVLSLLLTFNPISVCQGLSFYVDGQLSSLLVCIVSLICLFIMRNDTIIMCALSMASVIAINVKHHAMAYILICIAGGAAFLFLHKKKKACARLIRTFFLSFLLGFFIMGYNPYVTNALAFGNPLYPLYSTEGVCAMIPQMPANFPAMNRFERLFTSLFSESGNVQGAEAAKLKCPFFMSFEKLKYFCNTDIRVGGFGPLFGGAILLTLIVIVISIVSRQPEAPTALGALLCIMISVLVNPHAWWARYVPQLWMVPIAGIMLSLYSRNRASLCAGTLLCLVLTLNTLLVSFLHVYGQTYVNGILKKQLSYIASLHKPVYVKFASFRSNRVRLSELGIRYEEVEKLPCKRHIILMSCFLGASTRVCAEDTDDAGGIKEGLRKS